jgi:hypothetical protein
MFKKNVGKEALEQYVKKVLGKMKKSNLEYWG